jgi:ParB family chromosome partitioning protein
MGVDTGNGGEQEMPLKTTINVEDFDPTSDGNSKSKNCGKQLTKEDLINEKILLLPVAQISVKNNIRKAVNEETIKELASSIEERGLLHPVRVYSKNGKYFIICGQRRYLAFKLLEKEKLPCIVCAEPSDTELIYIQAAENEQTETLTPEDREGYILKLLEAGERVNDIAKKLGKSRQWIAKCVRSANFREKFADKLDKSDIKLTTTDNLILSNADEKTVELALELMLENPDQKSQIIKEIQKKVKGIASKKKPPKEKKKKELFNEDEELNERKPKKETNMVGIPPIDDYYNEPALPPEPLDSPPPVSDDEDINRIYRVMVKVCVNETTGTYRTNVENTGDKCDFPIVEAVRCFVDSYFKDKNMIDA